VIRHARTSAEFRELRRLLDRFASSIEANLEFEDFKRELAMPSGPYAGPDGRLLVWEEDGVLGGCIALANLGDGVCELRRLWVSPLFRGRGIGRELTHELLREARQIGYAKVRVHTGSTLLSVRAVYDGLGFYEIPPYASAHVGGEIFLEREL
jgi:GNAT superfamily N-acetyltransferase